MLWIMISFFTLPYFSFYPFVLVKVSLASSIQKNNISFVLVFLAKGRIFCPTLLVICGLLGLLVHEFIDPDYRFGCCPWDSLMIASLSCIDTLWPHIESCSEQLPNASLALGTNLRDFICTIYQGIMGNRAHLSVNCPINFELLKLED